VVPFLKVVNDTAVAVNQGGKRKGAVCAYLETWHMDIENSLICVRTPVMTVAVRMT
jgi:ribonucleotide reductase alpha subunit